MRYVPGEGPSDAKLMIVGEAPSTAETDSGRPFVGPSGMIVNDCLTANDSDRNLVYVTNVVKVQAPNSDIRNLKFIGKTISDYLPQLHAEIDSLKPNCILALGNTALEALTVQKGIEKYRGSILQYKNGPIKVVPSIHPASIFKTEEGKMRGWKDLTFIKWDFGRAIAQSKFKEFDLPRRNLIICRSSRDLISFLDKNKHRDKVSFDIETFRTVPICISFAFSKYEAISVPLFNFKSDINSTGITRTDTILIWRLIADLLADFNIKKIAQNGKFDQGQLEYCNNKVTWFGMVINSFYFDTKLAFRILYPELPASLAFMTSVLTEEPYYKDEGKEYNPSKDSFDRLLLYNAKDAVITFEIYEETLRELEERGLTDFFFSRQMPLHDFYRRLEQRGLLRDHFAQRLLLENYQDMRETLSQELNDLTAEHNIIVNVNSSKQVCNLLYVVLGVPARSGADEKILSALLRGSAIKDPRTKRVIELILEIRKVRKTITTYVEAEPDHRGRMITSYNIILETGRTSTNVVKSPIMTDVYGLAFQTITKHGDVGSDIRKMLVPDPGYVFVEADLSQAEARVVALLARDYKMLKMFDYKVDIHRMTAAWVEGNAPDDLINSFLDEEEIDTIWQLSKQINSILKGSIDEVLRQLGKKFRHAGHYDMGKRTASEQAHVSEWRAGNILTKFHATNPNIRGVFHKEIIEALQENERKLCNPFGRERLFLNKWGHDLFKEAYAQIPQSTVSDSVKFAGQRIEWRMPSIKIMQESHDSLLMQVLIGKESKAFDIIREEMMMPIDFSKCTLKRGELIIPCDLKIGTKNWKEMVDVQ